MKSFLEAVGRLSLVVFLLVPTSALATKTYAIITGSPSQIPDDEYRYMDASEGCSTVIVPPPDTACERNHRPAFSVLGSHPTQPSACTYKWDCTCGTCQIGEPNDPRNFDKIAPSQTNAYPKTTLVCPPGTTCAALSGELERRDGLALGSAGAVWSQCSG